jgi:hypothetical protein
VLRILKAKSKSLVIVSDNIRSSCKSCKSSRQRATTASPLTRTSHRPSSPTHHQNLPQPSHAGPTETQHCNNINVNIATETSEAELRKDRTPTVQSGPLPLHGTNKHKPKTFTSTLWFASGACIALPGPPYMQRFSCFSRRTNHPLLIMLKGGW